MNDIVATGVNIGSYDEPFMGTFDGNGHKITISFTYPSNDLGLFRYTRGATIKNLTIAGDITFYNNNPNSGNQYVGGVVARGDSTTIINCTNLANITVHGG